MLLLVLVLVLVLVPSLVVLLQRVHLQATLMQGLQLRLRRHLCLQPELGLGLELGLD